MRVINCHGINEMEEDERLGTQDLIKHGMTKEWLEEKARRVQIIDAFK